MCIRDRFDIVLVWKLDRFARNRYDSARYKTQLKKDVYKRQLQFSYDDFEFVENLYSSVFVLSADSSLNLKNLDDLEAVAYTHLGGGPCRRSSGQNSSDRHSR